jgi:peptidoglycan-associated lipoprotein
MRKRMMTVLIALTFICASFLVMASCAKKQVQVSEPVQPTTQEMTAEDEAKAKAEEAARQRAEEEAKAKAEAERQARLRELKQSQQLADEIRMFESDNIYFDFDKADLKPEAQATIRNKADWLRMNSSYAVRIEGHCDERGTNEYNLALGERRAHAAKKFLAALGISEDRISTISYGEERPADPTHNQEAWAKNRRDEFKLIK